GRHRRHGAAAPRRDRQPGRQDHGVGHALDADDCRGRWRHDWTVMRSGSRGLGVACRKLKRCYDARLTPDCRTKQGRNHPMASDSLGAETARRMFSDLCDPQAVNRAADDAWMASAWAALEEAGLPLAWVPDELGGGGAGLADGFAVLREAGRAAVLLPIA